MDKVFFHVDMDAFYAAIEQLDNPELRNRPVIVGGAGGSRGVVSTCSYEARSYGVRSAMPAVKARKLCPDAVFVPVRMKRYMCESKKIMGILSDFSPEVNVVSIDEAYLEMTGTQLVYGTPLEAGRRLKNEIFEKTGLTISIGIATNRMLAKLASEYDKPDGLYQINTGEEILFLDSLKLKDLKGIGEKTLKRLNQLGIDTIKQLRDYPLSLLSQMLGTGAADYIYKIVRGEDPGVYNDSPKSRSISNEITFESDISDESVLKKTLLDLSHHLMFRLMDCCCCTKTVSLKIRYSDFSTFTVQKTLDSIINCADDIYKSALVLLDKKLDRSMEVRLLGLSLMSLEDEGLKQMELFTENSSKKHRVEKAVHAIEKKKPQCRIFKASLLDYKSRKNQG